MEKKFFSKESEGIYKLICSINKGIMEHPDLESFPKYELRNENSLIYTCDTVFSNKPFTDEEYYSGIQEKIAFLIFSLNKGHVFIDGNKRTIESIVMFFIEMNQDLFEEELVDDFFRGRLASFLVYMLEKESTFETVLEWAKKELILL